MAPKRLRKGKPLLLATAGLATISFAACEPRAPVGNLRAPDPPYYPVGNLRAPEDMPVPDSGEDAGTMASPDAATTAEPQPLPPEEAPVGNLRPPPQAHDDR